MRIAYCDNCNKEIRNFIYIVSVYTEIDGLKITKPVSDGRMELCEKCYKKFKNTIKPFSMYDTLEKNIGE